MLFQKKTEEDYSQMLSPEHRPLGAAISGPHNSLGQRRPDGLPPRAVIDTGINILGCLQTDGEVQVDGKINGDVRCRHLTVGKTGTIIGDIAADEIVIRGSVKGAIRAGRVIIQEGAHVESEIHHDQIAIEEGAYFKGSSAPNEQQDIEEPEPHVVALQLMAGDMKSTA
jgi:cytoskeletal protein CcmA (bactofilin family)